MKRFLYVILGGLLVPLLGVLFTSSYVNAASPIDDIITTTDELILTKISGPPLDATLYWYDYMISAYEKRCDDFPTGSWCDIADWLIDQKDTENFLDGSWLVSKISNDMYNVTWSDVQNSTCDLNDNIEISPGRLNYFCEANQFFYTVIYYDPDNQYSSDIGVYTSTNTGVINISGGMVNLDFYDTDPVFFSTFNYIFPPEYEGAIPPDTIGPPLIERQVIAPDFAYNYEDYTITVTDHVNELIPEFVPDEGYTSNGPHVQWTLWKCSIEYKKGVCNGDREIIDLTDKPLNEGMTWTVEEYGFYKIEAEYSLTQCYRYASYPDTPDHCFNASLMALFGDNYVFEMRSKDINLNGSPGSGDTSSEDCDIMGSCSTSGSITGGMLPCFTSDFPYIDVQGCVTNVFWIVDSLTFSQVTIMNIQSNTLECKQLNTVGAWIHQPGITVCPLFPEHVRDVVTPFITFAFVLMLAGFIMRLGSDRST